MEDSERRKQIVYEIKTLQYVREDLERRLNRLHELLIGDHEHYLASTGLESLAQKRT